MSLAQRIREFPFNPDSVQVPVSEKGIAFLAYMDSWTTEWNDDIEEREEVGLTYAVPRFHTTTKATDPELYKWLEANTVWVRDDRVIFLPGAAGLLRIRSMSKTPYDGIQYYVQPSECREKLIALWDAGVPILIGACGRGLKGWSTTRNLILPPCWGDLVDPALFRYFLGTKETPAFSPRDLDVQLPADHRTPFNYAQMKARVCQLVALNDDVDAQDFLVELTPQCLAEIMSLAPNPEQKVTNPWAIWSTTTAKRLKGRWGWPLGKWAVEHPEMGTGLDPLSKLCVQAVAEGNSPDVPFEFMFSDQFGWKSTGAYVFSEDSWGGWGAAQAPEEHRASVLERRGVPTWGVLRGDTPCNLDEIARYVELHRGSRRGRTRLLGAGMSVGTSTVYFYERYSTDYLVTPGSHRGLLRPEVSNITLPATPLPRLRCLKLVEDGRRWSQHLAELVPTQEKPCSTT